MITIEKAREVLGRRAGGVLRRGKHAEPNGACKVCVRELRTLCLMEADLSVVWTDSPDGGGALDGVCQRLNDARWSSDVARTEGCLPLVLLSESTAVPDWQARYFIGTIRVIVPMTLRATARAVPSHAASLEAAALRCERDGDRDAAAAAIAIASAADAAAISASAISASAADAAAIASAVAYAEYAYADAEYASSTTADADADADAADAADAVLRASVALLVAACEARL